jgi:hypothetical protein
MPWNMTYRTLFLPEDHKAFLFPFSVKCLVVKSTLSCSIPPLSSYKIPHLYHRTRHNSIITSFTNCHDILRFISSLFFPPSRTTPQNMDFQPPQSPSRVPPLHLSSKRPHQLFDPQVTPGLHLLNTHAHQPPSLQRISGPCSKSLPTFLPPPALPAKSMVRYARRRLVFPRQGRSARILESFRQRAYDDCACGVGQGEKVGCS